MSVLDVDVSQFQSVRHTDNPKQINLWDWLSDDLYIEVLLDLRRLPDSDYRQQKKLLPGITPSGTFYNRKETGLINHSGLIQFDIDEADNSVSMKSIKEKLKLIPFVAYASISTSGKGLWGIIPIQNPSKHKSHFRAISSSFKKQGIIIDPAPSNVASFRFVSFDPDPYFNHDAKIYHYLIENQPKERYSLQSSKNSAVRIESLIDQIQSKRIDITRGYDNWIKIGFALADEYSDAGRDYFHTISRFHPEYETVEADVQYDKCLQSNGSGVTISTLFQICKDYNVLVNTNHFNAHRSSSRSKYKTQNEHPYGMNPYTGEIFDERGYPASWDDL